jgi:hypothetical protein
MPNKKVRDVVAEGGEKVGECAGEVSDSNARTIRRTDRSPLGKQTEIIVRLGEAPSTAC